MTATLALLAEEVQNPRVDAKRENIFKLGWSQELGTRIRSRNKTETETDKTTGTEED